MKCIPSQIRTRRQRIFRSIGQVDTVPDECEYATILRYRGNEVIFEGSSPMLPKEQQHHFTSFQQYISLLPQGPRKILEHSIFYDNAEQIAIALQNRVALAVTDASYEIDTNTGAAAWTIVGAQNNVYCEGRIGQPSLATETDPYRAETLGILAILTATEHICKYHKVTQGKITVACDNDASLENSIDRSTRMKTKKNYVDVFWAMQEIRSRIPITVESKKVDGHQDKKKAWNKLTRIEKLNCYADHESKAFRRWMETSNEYVPPQDFGDNNWSLWINNEKIIKNIRHTIIDHIQGASIKNHICLTTNITPEAVNEIDWDMVEKASKKLAVNRRLWLIKHVSGFAPTASKMHHRDEWDDDLCPQCKICRETTNHIDECSNSEAKKMRMKGIIKLRQWMNSCDTADVIQECICLTLVSGPQSTFTEMIRTSIKDAKMRTKIREAAESQDRIKWHNFVKEG